MTGRRNTHMLRRSMLKCSVWFVVGINTPDRLAIQKGIRKYGSPLSFPSPCVSRLHGPVSLFDSYSVVIIGVYSSHTTPIFLYLLRSFSHFLYTIHRHPRLPIYISDVRSQPIPESCRNQTCTSTSIANAIPKRPNPLLPIPREVIGFWIV